MFFNAVEIDYYARTLTDIHFQLNSIDQIAVTSQAAFSSSHFEAYDLQFVDRLVLLFLPGIKSL